MATTDFPLNSPLAVKRWSSELMKEALKRTHLLQFMGKSTGDLIQIKTEVNKAAGDRITFGLRAQLSGTGVAGDGTLEGNEEALETYTQNVVVDQLRHAVRSAGKMSEQRVPFSVRDEARDGLADWWADRIDTWGFNQLAGNTAQADSKYFGFNTPTAPDAAHVIYGATGDTGEGSLTTSASHGMSLVMIDKAVTQAKVAQNALRPISVGSSKYLVAFLHPYQVHQLRTNTNTGQWLDIQKAAMAGGKVTDNPIFTGALGVYNNVILHESTRIPLGAAANVRRAVVCGAQAAVMAFGRGSGANVYSWVEEMFDYGNQLGVAAGCIAGITKTRFNGSDFGTIVLSSYSPAP